MSLLFYGSIQKVRGHNFGLLQPPFPLGCTRSFWRTPYQKAWIQFVYLYLPLLSLKHTGRDPLSWHHPNIWGNYRVLAVLSSNYQLNNKFMFLDLRPKSWMEWRILGSMMLLVEKPIESHETLKYVWKYQASRSLIKIAAFTKLHKYDVHSYAETMEEEFLQLRREECTE